MNKILLLIILLSLYFQNIAFSEIRLFLYPTVSIKNEEMVLGDIASIDGSSDGVSILRDIMIPSELYFDGYIDKKEIATLLKNNSMDVFFIYGNAVRVIYSSSADSNANNKENGFTVKKGDRVYFVIKKKGINIEVNATALNDGKMDDEIFIKPETSVYRPKIFKGRVKSRDLIEAVL